MASDIVLNQGRRAHWLIPILCMGGFNPVVRLRLLMMSIRVELLGIPIRRHILVIMKLIVSTKFTALSMYSTSSLRATLKLPVYHLGLRARRSASFAIIAQTLALVKGVIMTYKFPVLGQGGP
eukprot:TRINITY_DN36036_c0_g1_i1.p2 TRINITY_DN36036_c0_g1~~TRINITY_DN36036_c0_g1_i1.p2  ORF type:complete len:131 (+),score=7.78 TRINITY_DN36036_c0_g1_i1:25-393(+)